MGKHRRLQKNNIWWILITTDETPRDAYHTCQLKLWLVRLYKPEMAETFFNYIWNGWLCLASPVLSNTGTDSGLTY